MDEDYMLCAIIHRPGLDPSRSWLMQLHDKLCGCYIWLEAFCGHFCNVAADGSGWIHMHAAIATVAGDLYQTCMSLCLR